MDLKEIVGLEAAKFASSGMIVGLGTGSTSNFFIRELARRTREEGLDIVCLPSSHASARLGHESGLRVLDAELVERVDLYVDGADEVDSAKRLLKGRGAAMVGEKILAEACDKFVVIIDESKRVDQLGSRFPVPVEVMPGGWMVARRRVQSLGGQVVLRTGSGKDGPVVTDRGNFVLDATFPAGADLNALDGALDSIPGVVGHGLFLRYAGKTTVLVGSSGGVRILP